MNFIGKNVQIADTAVIHEGVTIQDNVIIHDYVVVYPNSIIENNVEIFDHCVIGKLPVSPGITSRKLKTVYRDVIIGSSSVLSPGVVIYAGTTIGSLNLLGDFCSIREDCSTGNCCIISRNVSVNYNTVIGNNTKIMDNTHITGNMRIGNNVFISVLVATTNDNSMGKNDYSQNMLGPIIEDDVTVGAAANILPGIRIGRNAVIGAGSVVTKEVECSTVVMGVPAKFVRKLE